jgi:hypothetical protein
MLSNGSNLVLRDTAIQLCNYPIRILYRLARVHLFNLIPKVLFFNSGKGNESDAAPIPATDLITPHQDTAFLSVYTFLEPDNASLYRMIRLDTDTNYAAIHDFGKMICTHEIIKRDDLEGTVQIT